MQEITGAKPVRDASFVPPKHLERCTPLVWESARCNSGWGLHFGSRSHSHAVEPALRQAHAPVAPWAALGTGRDHTIHVSMQQPADFFCKEIRRLLHGDVN